MERSIRLLSFLPFLFQEVRSGYLRESNAVVEGTRTALPSRGNSEVTQPSVRRVLPQQRENYEYYDCSPNVVEFESVVFIEFSSDISNLTDSERHSLEQGFLSTYNALNEQYCDLSYHRSILDVTLEWPPRRRLKTRTTQEEDPFTVVVDGFNTADPFPRPNNTATIEDYQIVGVDGVLVTEKPQQDYIDIARFFVNVECHNCPTNTSLFSLSNETSPSPIHGAVANIAQGRASGLVMESCACLEDKRFATPFRAPTAAEFQASFNETVGGLHVDGVLQNFDEVEDLVEVDVVDCSSDKKKFSSTIIADLEGSAELLTAEERRALEQGFLETYNSFTFARCDRYFRQILEVKLISSQDRRFLLEEQWDDDDDYVMAANSTVFVNSTALTNDTLVFNSTESNSTRSTPAVYRVLGECRDCVVSPSGTFDLFDEGFRRVLTRNWLVPPAAAHHDRRLFQGSDDVCLCPASEEPTDAQAPSDQEFQDEYNTKVGKLQEEGVVVHVDSVDNVKNDEDVCEQELLEDTNYYIVGFKDELKGPSVEKKLREAFRAAYRVFDREVCGPLLSEVEVVEFDEVALEVTFEVVSIQTYNGSIFIDSTEEDLFVETLNEQLADERINSEAESLMLRAEPSAAPSMAPSVSVTPTFVPTQAPINGTLPEDKNGESTKQPTTETPQPTPVPTPRPTSAVPTTLGPSTPRPTAAETEMFGTPNPTTQTQTSQPTATSTTAVPTAVPTIPSTTVPTSAPTEDIMGLLPPLPPSEPAPSFPPSAAPSAAPTTEFDKIVDEVDEAVADIIKDIGETIERILGTVFPILSEIPGFLDAVEKSLEKLLGSDVDPDEVPGLLLHISEKIDELSRIPWLPQTPETYAQIQDTIDGLLKVLVPESPAQSPSEATLEPNPTTPSPTTELDKQIDEAEEAISDIIEDVGETLEKIVGHVVEVVDDIPKFLDNVGGVLEEIAGELPDMSDLSDLLEHVSDRVDEIGELSFVPDLPEATEKIKKSIRGILNFLRPAPSTDSPTSSPTARPTESPTAVLTERPTASGPTVPSPPTTVPTASPTATTVAPTEPPISTPQPSAPPSQPPSFPPTDTVNCGKSAKGSKGAECSEEKEEKKGRQDPGGSGSWLNAWDHLWGHDEEEPVEPPTVSPTLSPSEGPTSPPTLEPSAQPSPEPSATPTMPETETPTGEPSVQPSLAPTLLPGTPEPTQERSLAPSRVPSLAPTNLTFTGTPTVAQTREPTLQPTESPTLAPSLPPMATVTESPTNKPSDTEEPTSSPTKEPTARPTLPLETEELTDSPTEEPTVQPTKEPTQPPTSEATNEST